METTFDIFGDGSISENDPVAAVALADLKSVWAMQDDVQARQGFPFDAEELIKLIKKESEAG
jgi:hypothetical protein